jgi:hypothetical protein
MLWVFYKLAVLPVIVPSQQRFYSQCLANVMKTVQYYVKYLQWINMQNDVVLLDNL